EHDHPKWREVIPLYCGLAPAPAALGLIKGLIASETTSALAVILTESYFSSRPELKLDKALCDEIVVRVARSARGPNTQLSRFSTSQVASIANREGGMNTTPEYGEAYWWLRTHADQLDSADILARLQSRRTRPVKWVGALLDLLHLSGRDEHIHRIA